MTSAVRATIPVIPSDRNECQIRIRDRDVKLTNLQKQFWPDGATKGDLIRYYALMSPYLLPHIRDRALVMKRYPNGITGKFFFMKRTPDSHPDWLRTCSIEHASAGVIDFPIVDDVASLLWLVNLGCIDLNPWYARCDDTGRPDYLHFDLDPVPEATFDQVRETALRLRDALAQLKMKSYAKTTGSRGIHVYVPIVRGPLQKQVWGFAKKFSIALAMRHPALITAEYRVARRPAGHVLVDYNQNAWGRTLASVYSVRPKPLATASAPVTWDEVERGFELKDFRMANLPARVEQAGDLWKPLLGARSRVNLEPHL